MYHATNIRKKQLIGRKMLNIIKYLGMLALRPTASSSPENSNFSQKLYMSSTEAALEHRMSISTIDYDSRQTKKFTATECRSWPEREAIYCGIY